MALIFLGIAGAAAVFALIGVILVTVATGVCIALLLVSGSDQKHKNHLVFNSFFKACCLVPVMMNWPRNRKRHRGQQRENQKKTAESTKLNHEFH